MLEHEDDDRCMDCGATQGQACEQSCNTRGPISLEETLELKHALTRSQRQCLDILSDRIGRTVQEVAQIRDRRRTSTGKTLRELVGKGQAVREIIDRLGIRRVEYKKVS